MQSAKDTTNVNNDHNTTCNHVFYVSLVFQVVCIHMYDMYLFDFSTVICTLVLFCPP